MKFNRGKRGSLTVEAVISFAVFISFMFLLLSMVKISLVKITLENAVSETAKYLASASYPIGIFNDLADDANEGVVADVTEFKLVKDVQGKGIEALYDVLFADSEAAALKSADKGLEGMLKTVAGSGVNMLKAVVFKGVKNLITKEASKVTGSMISEIIDNSYVNIDKDNLVVTIAKLPVPTETYTFGYNTKQFTDMGITKNDFNKDDVVIAVEYVYKLTLPFMTTVDVKMRELAVEHAWIAGGAGNIPKRKEGLKMSALEDAVFGEEKVYVTNSHKRTKIYHNEDCFYLWNSKSEVFKNSLSGYSPCKRCAP